MHCKRFLIAANYCSDRLTQRTNKKKHFFLPSTKLSGIVEQCRLMVMFSEFNTLVPKVAMYNQALANNLKVCNQNSMNGDMNARDLAMQMLAAELSYYGNNPNYKDYSGHLASLIKLI